MARQKEFDVDAALEQAMDQFRRHGYEGTSMAELQQAMGIGRQSIYDTFGDKKQLFVRALELYKERSRETVAALLLEPDSSLPQLLEYFDQLITFLTPRDGNSGCLMAAAIVELGGDEPMVTTCCRESQKTVQSAMKSLLKRAQKRGELQESLDANATSLMLMGQVYGLTVLARNGAKRAELRRSVEQLIDSLRARDSH